MSRSSGLGFGGVFLGVGIGWVALNYLDVSLDVLPYLLILVGIGIVASSVLFKGQNRGMGELAGGLNGGLFIAVIFSGVFGLTDLFPFGSDITGSGDIVSKTFDLQDFSAIDAGYGFSLAVTQGDEYSLAVSVDDNVLDRLDMRKDGDTLNIGLDPGDYARMNLVARITMPSLNSIEFSGGTRGEISGFTSTRDFNVDLSGGSWAIIEGSAGDFIARVAINTNLGAAAGGITAMALIWILTKKADLSMAMNGALAGLVAITAPCAFVDPWAAIVIGVVGGIVVVLGTELLDKLRIDDPVGAVPVHGFNGLWGTIAIGLFGKESLGVANGGLFYGGGFTQLGIQLAGALSVAAFVFLGMGLIFKLIDLTIGLRVSREEEYRGLDIGEHGMQSYSGFQIIN